MIITKEIVKELSKYLSKKLPEVKQSKLLEYLSNFNGFKDWNTFSALSEQNNYNPNTLSWSKEYYLHFNNGGYFFAYNEENKILSVEVSCMDYVSTKNLFFMSKSDLKDIIKALKEYEGSYSIENEEGQENFSVFSKNGTWFFEEHRLNLTTTMNYISLSVSSKLIEIFENLIK